MFWALDPETREPIKAEPGLFGICPVCHNPVRSRCGDIYLWHWSHLDFDDARRTADCDSWHEPEGEWHFGWKSLVPQHMREFVIRREFLDYSDEESRFGVHRADILNSRGTVIELQHSKIDPREVRERENFYINMIWLFDAQNFTLKNHERLDEAHRYWWKYPRKYIWACNKPVFFHLGDKRIFRIERITRTIPCYVTGNMVDYKTFLSLYFQ